MNKQLHSRLALFIIAIAAGILVISTISILISTHYHFSMYQDQAMSLNHDLQSFSSHLEQAVVQSVLWTFTASIILAAFIGVYIAKQISKPLVNMKRVAERMTSGQLQAKVQVKGQDELADLGNSLNKLAEQLHKQEQLRVTMTEDIAHELRTPLATLKSHMRAFMDGIWKPTPERIYSCYEEIERLTGMVAELEELTLMESPEFKLDRMDTDLHATIKTGIELVSAAYLERNVALSFSCQSSIQLYVDRNRMLQILVNLLSNALKFTSPDSGSVQVEVISKENHVLILIKDNGVGLDEADLPYIFERFYRSDKSRNRKTGGSGLGLAIVKKLVEAHGGEVWAESKEGTTVYIRLPQEGTTSLS